MKTAEELKPSFKVGPLLIDTHQREARMDGAPVPLTDTEFDVLVQLAERKGAVMLRREFAPWNREPANWNRHPVDDVIVTLRRKLSPDVGIETVRGRGYRLDPSIPVTEVAGPSINLSERLKAIALDRMSVFTLPSLLATIQSYEKILQKGPDPDAYANLAISYINEGHTGFCLDLPQRSVAKARNTLQEALGHYPKFSSAFALRALTKAIYDFNWAGADADLKQAFALNADDEYAHLIAAHLDTARGAFDSGIHHAKRAAELDWRTPMTVFTMPWMMVFAGRADEALAECERAINDFDPFAVGHIICGYVWEALGVETKAIEEYEKSLKIAEFPDAYGCLGHAYGVQGDHKRALESLDKLSSMKIAYVSGWYEALINVGLAKKAEAVKCLEKALIQKCDWLIYLNVDPRWKPLRSEPRFHKLLAKVGLPATP